MYIYKIYIGIYTCIYTHVYLWASGEVTILISHLHEKFSFLLLHNVLQFTLLSCRTASNCLSKSLAVIYFHRKTRRFCHLQQRERSFIHTPHLYTHLMPECRYVFAVCLHADLIVSSPSVSFRFPGNAGVWWSGPLVRGRLLGGEDARRAPLLGPGALSGHLLWSTSGERLLPGSAMLRKQVPACADGAGENRLRHPADAWAGRSVGLQPQLLSHLHQVGHTGQPGHAHAAGSQGVPWILHQSFWLWQGRQPAEAERPRVLAAASDGLHGSDKLCEGLGTVLHQTVHQ